LQVAKESTGVLISQSRGIPVRGDVLVLKGLKGRDHSCSKIQKAGTESDSSRQSSKWGPKRDRSQATGSGHSLERKAK